VFGSRAAGIGSAEVNSGPVTRPSAPAPSARFRSRSGRAGRPAALLGAAAVTLAAATPAWADGPGSGDTVGRQGDGSLVTAQDQRLTPAGRQVEFPGRPDQVAIRPHGGTATFLTSQGGPLVVVDTVAGTVRQTFDPGASTGASYDGLAYSPDGSTLLASFAGVGTSGLTSQSASAQVAIVHVAQDGTLSAARLVAIGSGVTPLYPGGLAVSPDGTTAYVALSAANALGVIDVASASLTRQIPVGNAPHAVVLSPDGRTAYVSNQGGRPAGAGDTTDDSFGTPIVTGSPDQSGSSTGTVSVVDLAAATPAQVATVDVGLQPTAMTLHGSDLYVADTNSDQVTVVDTATRTARSTIEVQPFPQAPYGAQPNGLVVTRDDRLAVTLGRDNALAFFSLPTATAPAALLGLLPTGSSPAGVAQDPVSGALVVADDKGVGNVGPRSSGGDGTGGATGSGYVGSASLIGPPDSAALAAGTAAVSRDDGWDGIDTACAVPGVAPKAIPDHLGEPSPITHVFYVIKENRTYDQILGDDARGRGDPALVQFGAQNTPNQHQLVKQFPLLDNFYDSGQLSADGHQWVVQGFAPDYLEKMFGSFVRSYPSQGFDALAYLPSGFLWENAVRHGKTVRDYGEYATLQPNQKTISDIPSLQPLVDQDYPGFGTQISDQQRIQEYLNEFGADVAAGTVPNLTLMSLPDDHTTGYAPTYPSASSEVADNDLALGRMIDAISHSNVWASSAVIVEEDDSQNGLDHVDGHRSTLYLASPYARHGGVVDHSYYTQVNALRTIEQILGLPPMNQMDLAATPLRSAFTDTPDLTPFQTLPAQVPIPGTPGAANPPLSALSGLAREWAQASAAEDFSRPDAANPELLNRAVWYSTRGFGTPYPGDGRVLHPAEVGPVNLASAAAEGDLDAAARPGAPGAAALADLAHTSAVAARTAAAPAAGMPAALRRAGQVNGYACVPVAGATLPEAHRPVLFLGLAAAATAAVVTARRRPWRRRVRG